VGGCSKGSYLTVAEVWIGTTGNEVLQEQFVTSEMLVQSSRYTMDHQPYIAVTYPDDTVLASCTCTPQSLAILSRGRSYRLVKLQELLSMTIKRVDVGGRSRRETLHLRGS
jgi:hypothetical protein